MHLLGQSSWIRTCGCIVSQKLADTSMSCITIVFLLASYNQNLPSQTSENEIFPQIFWILFCVGSSIMFLIKYFIRKKRSWLWSFWCIFSCDFHFFFLFIFWSFGEHYRGCEDMIWFTHQVPLSKSISLCELCTNFYISSYLSKAPQVIWTLSYVTFNLVHLTSNAFLLLWTYMPSFKLCLCRILMPHLDFHLLLHSVAQMFFALYASR